MEANNTSLCVGRRVRVQKGWRPGRICVLTVVATAMVCYGGGCRENGFKATCAEGSSQLKVELDDM